MPILKRSRNIAAKKLKLDDQQHKSPCPCRKPNALKYWWCSPVPVGNLRSEILMVQSAQNWHRQRATDSLDGTRDRRVLVQRVRRTRRNAMAIARHSSHSELALELFFVGTGALRGCTALQELRHMPRLA